jgi:hypothetical protein
MIMGRFVCSASFMVVCLLIFSPSIRADRVDIFTDRTDSFFDNSIHFTDANSASLDGDFDDHHGKAWGWRRHHDGDSDANFGDQDNADKDDDGGNTGSTGSGGASTLAVPEPSVLVLLSTALAAFFLKSLRRATV